MTTTTAKLPALPRGAHARGMVPLLAWGILIALLAASWRGADKAKAPAKRTSSLDHFVHTLRTCAR